MDITRWSVLKSDYVLFSQRWRSSIQSVKTRPGADCRSDHELIIAKLRLKLKKVAETTRPFSSVQFSSVAQSCPTLCNLGDCSMPGLPVHHQLLELTQTHVHLILCHPFLLPPPSFPASESFQMSQFFTSGGQSIGISASASASVLPMNIQD